MLIQWLLSECFTKIGPVLSRAPNHFRPVALIYWATFGLRWALNWIPCRLHIVQALKWMMKSYTVSVAQIPLPPGLARKHFEDFVFRIFKCFQHHSAFTTYRKIWKSCSGLLSDCMDHQLPHKQTTVCKASWLCVSWGSKQPSEPLKVLSSLPCSSLCTPQTLNTTHTTAIFSSFLTTQPL